MLLTPAALVREWLSKIPQGMAIATLVVAAASCDRDGQPALEQSETEELLVAESATAQAREWREGPSERQVLLGTSEAPLLDPMAVKVTPDGGIYVLDFGALDVKQFSPSGDLVRIYGEGRGAGPGEMQNPTDFDVHEDGSVWVLDPALGRISIFDPEGEPLRTLPVDVPALRLIVFPDEGYILHALSSDLFWSYDAEGQRLHSFGLFMEDQIRKGLALQGHIAKSGDSAFVFAPYRAGYLAKFSRSGSPLFYRETVDGSPFPPVEVLPNGGTRIAPEFVDQAVTWKVSTRGDSIFLLGRAQRDGQRVTVIDVYSGSDGAYLHSFQSPQSGLKSMGISQNALFTVADTTVTGWSR